jgi:hypothetical protein
MSICLLEAEIGDPENASNYSLLSEKCTQLEEAKSVLDRLYDRLVEFGE